MGFAAVLAVLAWTVLVPVFGPGVTGNLRLDATSQPQFQLTAAHAPLIDVQPSGAALLSAGNLAPGDTAHASVGLTATGPTPVWLVVVDVSGTTASTDLPASMAVRVFDETTHVVVYDGTLRGLPGLPLDSRTGVSTWLPGEHHAIDLAFRVPAAIGNAYQASSASLLVAWGGNSLAGGVSGVSGGPGQPATGLWVAGDLALPVLLALAGALLMLASARRGQNVSSH